MTSDSNNNLLWALVLANLALMFAYVARRCLSRRGIEFNHIATLSLGYFMYWLLPLLIAQSRLFADNPNCRVWYILVDSVSFEAKALYLWVCLAAYGAFIVGSELCARQEAGRPKPVYRAIRFPMVYMKAALLLCGAIVCYFTYAARQDLFQGYATIGTAGDLRRSVLISSTGLLEAVAFLYCMKREERLRARFGVENPTFWQVVFNRAMICYGIAALLVMSTGHRLSAMSSFMMLLIYATTYFRRLRLRSALFTLGAGLGVMGMVGLVRASTAVSSASFLITVFLEPIQASIVLFSFLKAGRLELLNFPVYLISGFSNLLPHPLFPDKASLILTPASGGYVLYAPNGSLHSFVEFCINFGLVGTVGVWFLLGYGLQKLKMSDKSMLHRTSYIMISGFLMTSFFRDGFSISIVKTITQISILIPLFCAITANMLFNYMHPSAPSGLAVGKLEAEAS